MSLKENVAYIKDEISNEEKFFESFFKLEKFYKKYKYIIIIVFVGTFGYFIISNIMKYVNEQNTIKANNAYNKVLKNPNDTNSLAILKETNAKLLEIANFINTKDKTKAIDVIYLKQIAMYNKAIKNNDIKMLNKLIINQQFVLRDYAIFTKALIQVEQKNYKKAKNTLKSISNDSGIEALSDMLKHFLLTK
jgi:hypothetical protein